MNGNFRKMLAKKQFSGVFRFVADVSAIEWTQPMYHNATGRAGPLCGILFVALASQAIAQAPAHPQWRHIGNSGIDLSLASPASGPVERVWFSPDGSRLFVRTGSGQEFETADFEKWQPSAATPPAASDPAAPPPALPDGSGNIRTNGVNPSRLYAFGAQVFRSDDGGSSWSNVTAYKNRSIIAGGMRDLAVSPRDSDEIVVGNEAGVWRSLDGGTTWTGLNESLPNLPALRFAGLPQGSRGVRLAAGDAGTIEWAPGEKLAWRSVTDAVATEDGAARRAASLSLGTEITAIAAAGDTVYAGSADGRLWVTMDKGRTWSVPSAAGRGPVESIWLDPREPRIALAALGGHGAHVLRTINGGQFWDDVTSDLPDAAAHGVAAERASGAVYVAGDAGVFFTRTDLNVAGPASAWTRLDGLPSGRALDVRLDAGGNQLFVIAEGYGVYAAMAPHRFSAPRLVNAADFSARAAAPGSLLSFLGAAVRTARFGDTNFPVLAASAAESQIQVPFTVNGPSVSLALDTGQGRVRISVPVEGVSPAIFVDRDGTPLILNTDTGILLDGMNPARSNSRLQILATGLGKVRPDWPAGRPGPADNPPEVVSPVRAYVDRAPVEVTRAILAPGYVGLYLIEIQMPAVLNAGSAELYLESENQTSNRVRLWTEP